jgi:hypothetical protein
VFQTPPSQVTKLIIRMPAHNTALPLVLSHLLQPNFFPNLRELHIVLDGSSVQDVSGTIPDVSIEDRIFPASDARILELVHLCLFKIEDITPFKNFFCIVEAACKPGAAILSLDW